VNTSELVAKITEAYSISKTQAQGIVDRKLKSLASARRRNGGRPFKLTAAKLRLAPAGQPVRSEKIKIAASRKLTYSPAKAVKALLND
jgi:DNA-binding protein HU-beta